jgi:diguanylate cyclase (GGDEF)-like protein
MALDIVSLRDSLNSLERQDARFQKALKCYLAALAGVEEHVFQQCAAKLGEPPLTLEPERQRLKRTPDDEAWESARGGLDGSLRTASDRIQRQLAGRVELAEVVKLLEQTTLSMTRRGDARESRFIGVKQGLETAAALEDVDEFRGRILQQVNELGRLVDEMREENRQLVEELDSEMSHYRRKLDEAEEMANRDTLTGLANRRMLERRVQAQIEGGTEFSLLMIDLDRFKMINDHHGHLAGDELLRAFALRLKNNTRSDDTSARWGGDEFVVLMPCALRDAMKRAQLLELALRGEYALKLEPRPVRISLGLSLGVAEYKAGETADQLLARADGVLYASKARRPA